MESKREKQAYEKTNDEKIAKPLPSTDPVYRVEINATFRGDTTAKIDDTNVDIHIRNLLRTGQLSPHTNVPLCGIFLGVFSLIRTDYTCGIILPRGGMSIGYDVTARVYHIKLMTKDWAIPVLHLTDYLFIDSSPGDYAIEIRLSVERQDAKPSITVSSKSIKRIICEMYGIKHLSNFLKR
ncbi:hypothetical protein [Potato cyst nematode rhabdovirus]|nr:hypothetical protein [Potato cyst nematode rhabdovirus]DAZ92283.1 TPA_asm: hypothetical protein [Potato cyst nematode rhabdovirus]